MESKSVIFEKHTVRTSYTSGHTQTELALHCISKNIPVPVIPGQLVTLNDKQ